MFNFKTIKSIRTIIILNSSEKKKGKKKQEKFVCELWSVLYNYKVCKHFN